MSDADAVGIAALLGPLAHATDSERLVGVAYLAGRDVELDPAELSASIRRSQLLLAAGGDPRRTLELGGRAVVALAEDTDAEDRRAALQAGLASLAGPLAGTAPLADAVARLRADEHLAWRAYAAALLADSLADDD